MPCVVCIVLGRFIAGRLMSDMASEIAYKEWVAMNPSPKQEIKQEKGAAVVVGSSKSKLIPNRQEVIASSSSIPLNPDAFPHPHPGAALPLTFHPTNLSTLIIGSHRLAATRAFAFLESGSNVTILSSQPIDASHAEIRHRVSNNQVHFIQKSFKTEDEWTIYLDEGCFALVCVTETLIGHAHRRDVAAAGIISRACRKLHIPVNVSDHPPLSTFSFPSIHRFSGADGLPSHLQVAVSTNGHGCRLSGRIKREIVTRLPPGIGAAVDNVGRLRARAKGRDGSRERKVSEEDPDTPLNIPVPQLDTPSLLNRVSSQLGSASKDGNDEQLRRMRWVHQMSEYHPFEALARMSESEMEDALTTWGDRAVSNDPTLPQHEGATLLPSALSTKGRIFLVGSGPGHPGLLTLAAHHALRSATLILSDKLVPSEILALIPSTTKISIAKKFPGNNEGAQNELMIQALEAARSGEVVVRLKQGDPFVYGRGGEEVLYFREHGIEATVVPGVTSVVAGPEMVGIPVTQRGVAEGMVLCTGVGRAGKSVSLPGYVKPRTLVVLMGVARIESIVSTLIDPSSDGRDGEAYPGHLPIAVIERASSPDQRVIVSTLSQIAEAVKSVEERPPGMMVIGWTVLALEGKGRVDVLDGVDEKEVVHDWLSGDRWRIREGLDDGWGGYFAGLGS